MTGSMGILREYRTLLCLSLQINHIGSKLDDLCRIMSARKERRESRKGAALPHTSQHDDLLGGE